jgi:hypothetical protein
MKFWPDWDSVDSVKKAEAFYFWTGWVFFALLVGFEAVARVYQIRKDTLVEIRDERITEQRQRETEKAEKKHQAEIDSIRSQSDQAKKIAQTTASQQAQRRLSQDQQNILIAMLAKHKGSVMITCVLGSTEGRGYAADFENVFQKAGWNCNGVDQVAYINNPIGVQLTVNETYRTNPIAAPDFIGPLCAALIDMKIMNRNEVSTSVNVPWGKVDLGIGAMTPIQ